ncbi:uncharacterized protein C8Q71DRAFT_109152 [Rhodofomes roseus]|uniref:Uncharacterized protein n=1 Tax=Rhodofomes roseus TaxID=34475 RepID=A0ABQ8KCK2_9APHY|nr:uncharacterized protein C8Q71DRAFT_109152 [Rhodofomes roseus]KAH9835221.1 hypothetical protein C8Q71DRAFT_109152 [Rhodofomes roseus]
MPIGFPPPSALRGSVAEASFSLGPPRHASDRKRSQAVISVVRARWSCWARLTNIGSSQAQKATRRSMPSHSMDSLGAVITDCDSTLWQIIRIRVRGDIDYGPSLQADWLYHTSARPPQICQIWQNPGSVACHELAARLQSLILVVKERVRCQQRAVNEAGLFVVCMVPGSALLHYSLVICVHIVLPLRVGQPCQVRLGCVGLAPRSLFRHPSHTFLQFTSFRWQSCNANTPGINVAGCEVVLQWGLKLARLS